MSNKYENEALDHGINAPGWIDEGITLGDIVSIANYGCASYAYMPAVTYYEAKRIMGMWGDEVTDYISENSDLSCAEILQNAGAEESYSLMCCALLSFAVELWCWSHYDAVEEILNEDEDEDEDEEEVAA